MNIDPLSNSSPRELSVDCIRYLRYSLAGNIESVDLLDQLSAQIKAIQWDDPAFNAFTEQMRGDQVESPLGNDQNSSARFQALAFALTEIRASGAEDLASMKSWILAYIAEVEKTNAMVAKLSKFASEATGLHVKMYRQLELLGADVSSYELPEI